MSATNLLQLVRSMLGTTNYPYLEYIAAAMLGFFVLNCAYSVLYTIFQWIGGKR